MSQPLDVSEVLRPLFIFQLDQRVRDMVRSVEALDETGALFLSFRPTCSFADDFAASEILRYYLRLHFDED